MGTAIRQAGVNYLLLCNKLIQISEPQTINICHFEDKQECSTLQCFLGSTGLEDVHRIPQKKTKLFLK